MSEAEKVTPGPWEAVGNLVRSPMHQPDGLPRGVQIVECMDGYSQPFTEEAKANARLIAEAGTVHHETGLTPRQLVEQRAELVAAIEALLYADVGDDFNGFTQEQRDAQDRANAILSLVKGESK